MNSYNVNVHVNVYQSGFLTIANRKIVVISMTHKKHSGDLAGKKLE